MYVQDQCTPLYIAANRGFNEIVRLLLAANANVNSISKVSCHAQEIIMYLTCICYFLCTGTMHSTVCCFS